MNNRVRAAGGLAAPLAIALSSCATVDVNEYCKHSSQEAIRSSDPDSLALVLGAPPRRLSDSFLVVFHSPSQSDSERSIAAMVVPGARSLPSGLDESQCSGVDWTTYALEVDASEWRAFWADERSRRFEIGVGFLDDFRPLRSDSFGVAIVDSGTGDYYFSCGCYWK